MQIIGKYIFLAGLVLMVSGGIIWLAGDKLGWLGNLPGDIHIKKENFSFYMPVTTMILISIILSIIIWLIRKFI